jgi:hypothetical protein
MQLTFWRFKDTSLRECVREIIYIICRHTKPTSQQVEWGYWSGGWRWIGSSNWWWSRRWNWCWRWKDVGGGAGNVVGLKVGIFAGNGVCASWGHAQVGFPSGDQVRVFTLGCSSRGVQVRMSWISGFRFFDRVRLPTTSRSESTREVLVMRDNKPIPNTEALKRKLRPPIRTEFSNTRT